MITHLLDDGKLQRIPDADASEMEQDSNIGDHRNNGGDGNESMSSLFSCSRDDEISHMH